MYYAFYARHWAGPVALRGLEDRNDCVVDYVSVEYPATVSERGADLAVRHAAYTLLEVWPL